MKTSPTLSRKLMPRLVMGSDINPDASEEGSKQRVSKKKINQSRTW